MSSYAVIWRDASARSFIGKLELGASSLTLEGSDAGAPVQHTISYADAEVTETDERLQGHRAVAFADGEGRPLLIASLDRPGTAHEFTERIAAHHSRMVARLSPHERPRAGDDMSRPPDEEQSP